MIDLCYTGRVKTVQAVLTMLKDVDNKPREPARRVFEYVKKRSGDEVYVKPYSREYHELRRNYLSEYRAWKAMKQRCCNPTHERYQDYGGRGIRVCDRWLDSFVKFLEDMQPKPSPP